MTIYRKRILRCLTLLTVALSAPVLRADDPCAADAQQVSRLVAAFPANLAGNPAGSRFDVKPAGSPNSYWVSYYTGQSVGFTRQVGPPVDEGALSVTAHRLSGYPGLFLGFQHGMMRGCSYLIVSTAGRFNVSVPPGGIRDIDGDGESEVVITEPEQPWLGGCNTGRAGRRSWVTVARFDPLTGTTKDASAQYPAFYAEFADDLRHVASWLPADASAACRQGFARMIARADSLTGRTRALPPANGDAILESARRLHESAVKLVPLDSGPVIASVVRAANSIEALLRSDPGYARRDEALLRLGRCKALLNSTQPEAAGFVAAHAQEYTRSESDGGSFYAGADFQKLFSLMPQSPYAAAAMLDYGATQERGECEGDAACGLRRGLNRYEALVRRYPATAEAAEAIRRINLDGIPGAATTPFLSDDAFTRKQFIEQLRRYEAAVRSSGVSFPDATSAIARGYLAVGAGAAAAPVSTGSRGPVDINSASLDELKQLPGIGEAYAAKIVRGRPFQSIDDLRTRAIVPEAVFQGIRGRIVAR